MEILENKMTVKKYILKELDVAHASYFSSQYAIEQMSKNLFKNKNCIYLDGKTTQYLWKHPLH